MLTELSELDESAYLIDEYHNLTDTILQISPSEWAEANRYLPPGVTPLPGFYDYRVAPYLREIIDCCDVRCPVREITLMKGSQIGATVGILENFIGYSMAHVKNAPMMMVTADAELAKLRMESYITPMMQQSGLMEFIQSTDEMNSRKSGKTDKKIEWRGGGYLIPFGAQNANKLRSLSIRFLLKDEPDGWPDTVGADGDPSELANARTEAYEQIRKILNLSTPLIAGSSRIEKMFELGDQRYYYVPCKKCGLMQVLEFWGEHEDGSRWGMVWQTEGDGRLVPGSVRYKCREITCGHEHKNDDKVWMFPRGEWQPTQKSSSPTLRSYHLSGLYAPAAMKTWESGVLQYLKGWDVAGVRPRDLGAYQVFRNNFLGKTYAIRGDKVSFQAVSAHRRAEYRYGELSNQMAIEQTGHMISFVTCAVDVHKEYLFVACFGWTRGGRCYLLDYDVLEGDAENIDDAATWGALRDIIERREYIADDGKIYRPIQTNIDAGYNNSLVTQFCAEYRIGVAPILGRDTPTKSQRIQEFAPFTTTLGTVGYRVTVDIYKDRWSAALRRVWVEGTQPMWFFNAPGDCTDKQLTELTKEVKREKIEKRTGRRIGFEWWRPSGAHQELWDLLIYNTAAMEMVAWDVCINQLQLESVNWTAFFDLCENQHLYFSVPDPKTKGIVARSDDTPDGD